MKLAIADPPYLGRAVRWYGKDGCGEGYGKSQADNHPDAALWDIPSTHQKLVEDLIKDYDGFAIAMSVHSLSTYLQIVETDSRNGMGVCVWHKPNAVTSGNRISNRWEPVLIKVPSNRKGWDSGLARCSDVLIASPPSAGFVGSKPPEWTHWVMDLLGYQEGDKVDDLFQGSGMVTDAINHYQARLDI